MLTWIKCLIVAIIQQNCPRGLVAGDLGAACLKTELVP
jgi:hypothetical protein